MADDTNAQVNEAVGTEGTDQGAAGNEETTQNAGFQARVDELTRARREAERQRDELVATVARLSAQGQSNVPTPAMPEFDPDTKKVLDTYVSTYVGPQIAAMRQELEQARMAAMAGTLHQEAQGEDPRILARAQELLPAVLKAGWAPQDAVNFARGEIYAADARTGGTRARDTGGRFNGAPVMTANAAPPPMQRNAPALPANFDNLPPDKQLEILEKRGAGNASLFGDGE